MGFSSIEGNIKVNSDVGIVLPTYCEGANIEKIVQELENLNLKISILVIDDSSPDGTADIVRSLQKKHEGILLLVRPKKSGLGTAITDGFRVFMSLRNSPKYLVTMDADYSHNPNDIPRLVSTSQSGCDLVIGSRYCRGGNALNWGMFRRAVSKVANLIASIVVGAKIHDFTSGLRCYSAGLVKQIIGDLHSQTYEIQIETIRQSWLRNFRIREIPIIFANRKNGKSKLSINEVKQFLSYIVLKVILKKG